MGVTYLDQSCTPVAESEQAQGGTRSVETGLVYDWFSEGFDTADLKDAKALLDELE
jgi:hypothetical protein